MTPPARRYDMAISYAGKGPNWNNQQIAAELHSSPKTVNNHVLGIFNTLQVTDRVQAVDKAQEAQGTLGSLNTPLPEYARVTTVAYLLTHSLTLLTAAALIWYRPRQWAAVFGAFTLSAAATGTLAQATARTVLVLELPAQFIHFVLLVALLPFFGLIPDGRFRPAWLRWIALAIVPAASLVAFDVVGWQRAMPPTP